MHVGPSGAGHFAKMIHNGIEYGMMQAYGEGFELLAASEFGYDLAAIAHLWNRGSVVRSWLLELAERVSSRPDPRELDMLLSTGERTTCALVAMALARFSFDLRRVGA